MFLGGLFFLLGALLNVVVVHISILILGRILLGVGVRFANQSVPIYLSEIAPYKYMGTFNVLFQLVITIGILIANVVKSWVTVYICGDYFLIFNFVAPSHHSGDYFFILNLCSTVPSFQ